ncbi:hypothetical protein A0H81_01196 [Grifola frondosa]|uniref:DUF6729 domain-containing protein n=1 Tax=Grifola frondosa TaxID=5627 RepID=A0A1C7MRR4_GRIFR|nr:hypothetical protein A0H81_01196 [Grifola frondosa]
MSDTPVAPRRGRGRPKGTKNGPNAGHVGRPRKDGQPPAKRQQSARSHNTPPPTASAARTPTTEVDMCGGPDISEDEVQYTDSSPNRQSAEASQASGDENIALAATTNNAPHTARPSDKTVEGSFSSADDASNDVMHHAYRPSFCADNLAITGLTTQVEELVDNIEPMINVPNPTTINSPASSQHKEANRNIYLTNKWSPPKGVGVFGRGDDGVDCDMLEYDEEEGDLFGDESLSDESRTNISPEFEAIPDDDEEIMKDGSSSETGASRKRSTLPSWLSKDYENTRERLADEMRKNVSRRPTCYDRGTFTEGPICAFFSVDRKFQPTPEDFYHPTYFVWLPHLLIDRIPCPACMSVSRLSKDGHPVYLRANGWPKSPRRVVDLERCLYLIGYRYYCPNSTCGKSYQSWSPALLASLPRAISLHFTHHLTYRNGVTDLVASLMRAAYLLGIGPVPFAQMIRSNHVRYYERLHLQYAEMVYARQKSSFAHLLAKFKPFGQFDDCNGYTGYSPSARYFRDLYVHLISSHAPEIDQYSSMLSAKLLQVDHTFKIVDHIGKINGIRVFNALHTSINEYGEIRSMIMTPTKAHDQFMPALRAVSDSLKTYGHGPIELVYTDNVPGDKPELEHLLPSLLNDVISVPDSSSLEHLTLPLDCNIVMLSSAFQVNTRLGSIIASLRIKEDLYAAVDMEWSVDLESEIYLLPLHSYLQDGILKLPSKLLVFMHMPSIRKIEVRISGDLTRLFNDCGFTSGKDEPFTGALDLGKLAKDHNAAARVTIGLADLTAFILSSTHVGQLVDNAMPGGTAVSLFSSDHSRVVAHGFITPDQPKQHLGVKVTKTRVLVTITDIVVPGHLIPADLLPSHIDTPLLSLPPTPFHLLCKTRHVRTRSGGSPIKYNPVLRCRCGPCLTHHYQLRISAAVPPNIIWHHDIDVPEVIEQTPEESSHDPDSEMQGEAMIQKLSHILHDGSDEPLHSRVLGDIWHLMDQFPISMQHGLRRPFARALRDAFFIPDPEDKAAVVDFLKAKGVTWDHMLYTHSGWLLKRVRRFVPPAEELLPHVAKVLRGYGLLKDAMTGLPLFNDCAWTIVDAVLREYPPRLLFRPTRCVRGTNGIEGGIHQNIVCRFGSFNAVPDFAIQLLRDYTLSHNLLKRKTVQGFRIEVLSTFGQKTDSCSFSTLRRTASHHFHSISVPAVGLMGTDMFTQLKCSASCLYLTNIDQNIGMLVYHPQFAKEQEIRYQYLAKQQGTRVAVLPVHTKAERALFWLLVAQSDGMSAGKWKPNWQAVSPRWVDHSDGKTIFYKLPEHLKSYWKTWGKNVNEKSSIKINQATYNEIETLLTPKSSKRLGNARSIPVAQAKSVHDQLFQNRSHAPVNAATVPTVTVAGIANPAMWTHQVPTMTPTVRVQMQMEPTHKVEELASDVEYQMQR